MDPLCISLVHQHLLSSCPNLAQELSAKFKPKVAEVGLEQVLGKWEEAELTKRLVHQYLECAAPSLVAEFNLKHGSPLKMTDYTRVTLEEVVANWKEELMINGLVYQHLRTVAPDLATEFKVNHYCCYFEEVPEPQALLRNSPEEMTQLIEEMQKKNDDGGDGKRCNIMQSVRVFDFISLTSTYFMH